MARKLPFRSRPNPGMSGMSVGRAPSREADRQESTQSRHSGRLSFDPRTGPPTTSAPRSTAKPALGRPRDVGVVSLTRLAPWGTAGLPCRLLHPDRGAAGNGRTARSWSPAGQALPELPIERHTRKPHPTATRRESGMAGKRVLVVDDNQTLARSGERRPTQVLIRLRGRGDAGESIAARKAGSSCRL
jgi:hypothetical protein